jgi:hypothetical protein
MVQADHGAPDQCACTTMVLGVKNKTRPVGECNKGLEQCCLNAVNTCAGNRLSRSIGPTLIKALVAGTDRVVAHSYDAHPKAPKIYERLPPGLAAIPANLDPQATLTPTAPNASNKTRSNCILVRDSIFRDASMCGKVFRHCRLLCAKQSSITASCSPKVFSKLEIGFFAW